MTRLDRAFFSRDTLVVARELLGCVLVHQLDGQRLAGRIVEVEAYKGWDDAASHGYRGITPRNTVMFHEPGISYVYLCYGVHWLLNIVARPPDVDWPAAILLRALEPVEGLESMARRREGRPARDWTNGPGRLTRALGIDKAQHGIDMVGRDSLLTIERGDPLPDKAVMTGPRIGINVPEPSRSWPWRYWMKDNPHVSATR